MVKLSLWALLPAVASVAAQGNIAELLQSQSDLSTLLELVGQVDGLADLLSSASNITIFAPTNEAFDGVPRDIPEGEAIENMNDTVAIGALLSNHVFQGYYESTDATEVPIFVQSLLNSSFANERQPFSNFTGGQYNGIVKNGDSVSVLSGEEAIATVTEADIKLGKGIVIHKIDDVLRFGAPLQLFAARSGLNAFNAAVGAADLGINFGLSDPGSDAVNISDFTIFVPNDEAFQAIGSVLESADLETIQAVLSHHVIANNVIFSPSLGNVTVPSLQGTNLTFTVLPDGTAWVNDAKIIFPNAILFNGVAHIIDSVLNPEDFDRDSIDVDAVATDRVAFPSATSVASLPFSSVSFSDDTETYTTPSLLRTIQAVATADASQTTSDEPTATGSGDVPETTGAANKMAAGSFLVGIAVAVALINA